MFLKSPLKKYKKTKEKNKISVFFLSFYQAFFSGFIGGACRFYPSCSVYAQLVYKNYPFFKATLFVLKRLLSCSPLGPKWREEIEIQPFLEKK